MIKHKGLFKSEKLQIRVNNASRNDYPKQSIWSEIFHIDNDVKGSTQNLNVWKQQLILKQHSIL